MNPAVHRALTPFCQELPYRPLWPLAPALMGREAGVVFLDSAGDPDADNRWTILAWRPRRVIVWPQGQPGPLAALREICAGVGLRRPPDFPAPFAGGWIGWFAYDLGRHLERLPAIAAADPAVPDFALGEYDVALVEDRLARRLYLSGACEQPSDSAALRARVQEAVERTADQESAPTGATPRGVALRPCLDRDAYRDRVARILAYIRAGDVYQVNFSHRFDTMVQESSGAIYQRLRTAGTAPFGGYWGLPGSPEVLSASPELFLRRTGARVESRPIKGTRPRSPDPRRDAVLREELHTSAKEQAELLMIVDLVRNDLGRVARIGSVRVETLRALRAYSAVHHAVATVTAELPPEIDAAALLAATMPGGSVTGAPKIRAMEILEELESVRRGAYTGCAGFIGYDGDLCLNLLIRTIVREGERAHFHVGGGIVADSEAGAEYEETLAKAAVMLRALQGGAA